MIGPRTITLEEFQKLPESVRRCSFWETLGKGSGDSLFDREAWVFDVSQVWGSCLSLLEDRKKNNGVLATFAPARLIPRSTEFPTSPVSSDAILLSRIQTYGPKVVKADDIDRLIFGVIDTMRGRGVRAIEAFAATENIPERIRKKIEKGCIDNKCIIPEKVLLSVGFETVAPHPYYPRMRIEVAEGLTWKSSVEAALDQLLVSSQQEGNERKLMLV